MIIKATPIASSHAGNAIRYAMEKDSKQGGERPQFLYAQHIATNITGEPFPNDVYDAMRLRQLSSGHNLSSPFWRIEICPPKEESKNWTDEQWQQCLQDAIRLMDAQDYVNPKTGKVPTKTCKDRNGNNVTVPQVGHFKLSDCQLIATIHWETDDPHIHVIANRVTEHNEVMDTHKCDTRALLAANAFAVEYGWIKAEDRGNQRKERIHADAIEVLKSMQTFSLEQYFAGMRAKGWIVEPGTPDQNGKIHGYSIGEKLYKKNHQPSSTVMYKASSLGHGRDLTVSRLERTWKKLKYPELYTNKERPRWKRPPITPAMPKEKKRSKGEQERMAAVQDGRKSLRNKQENPRKDFSLRDIEDILPAAIIAHAIEKFGTATTAESRTNAALDLVNDVADNAEAVMQGITSEVLNTLLTPAISPSGGGGGNNDLPKRKDDEWEWWKQNNFGRRNSRSRGRR